MQSTKAEAALALWAGGKLGGRGNFAFRDTARMFALRATDNHAEFHLLTKQRDKAWSMYNGGGL